MTNDPYKLKQRYGGWAVVTGASDGIGREFAKSLAEAGLNLVLVARRGEVLQALAEELSARHATRTMVVAADLSEQGAIEDLLARTRELDVGLFVASAGFGTSGRFLDAPIARELNMIDVNCRAVAALSHGYATRFVERRRGGLVLLSSLLAFQGVPRAANYAATKAWVQTFAEGLRVELAPLGVDVIASAPGPIASGFAQRADMRMSMALPASAVASGTLRALGRRVTVRPGWLSKALEWSLALLPRWGRVRVMSMVMSGMTSHRA